MRDGIKAVVNGGLTRIGYRVVRNNPPPEDPISLRAALRRIARRVPEVATIVDVGASDGQWSRSAREFYPRSRCLLIEANEVHAPALERYRAESADIEYVLAAAGDVVGELFFSGADPFGGLASHEQAPGMTRLPATTIDHEVKQRGLKGPYLVKLDTHGFERPILVGASETLKSADLLVIEVYNFAPGSMLFFELCEYLRGLGFLPAGMCDPLFRPRDQMLWQFDLLFIRGDRPEFAVHDYQ